MFERTTLRRKKENNTLVQTLLRPFKIADNYTVSTLCQWHSHILLFHEYFLCQKHAKRNDFSNNVLGKYRNPMTGNGYFHCSFEGEYYMFDNEMYRERKKNRREKLSLVEQKNF